MDLNIRGLMCTSVLSLALGAAFSPAAERTPGDAPDTKIALVPEPTESPRYLQDEQQTSSGSVVIGGRSFGIQSGSFRVGLGFCRILSCFSPRGPFTKIDTHSPDKRNKAIRHVTILSYEIMV